MMRIRKYLHLTDREAFKLLGGCMGLAYLMPVFGGTIADKLLNTKHIIILGLVLLAISFFGIALSGHQLTGLKFCLAIVACGHGLVGPNLSKEFYTFIKLKSNNLCQSYLRYYFADTIGQAVGGIGCGFIGVYLGYSSAFILGALFLLLSLYCYIVINKGQLRLILNAQQKTKRLFALASIVFLVIVSIGIIETGTAYVAVFTVFVVTSVIVAYIIYKNDAKIRKDIRLLLLVLSLGIIVISCIWQSTGLLNLFTDRYVNRHLFAFTIPANALDSLDPIFAVMLIIIAFLTAKKHPFHFTDTKLLLNINFGLYAIGLGFFVLGLGITLTLPTLQRLNLNWIIIYYVFQATAGIFIIPTIMGANIKLAPETYRGYFIGYFELVIGVSSYVTTASGRYFDAYVKAHVMKSELVLQSLLIYRGYFYLTGVIVCLCAAVLSLFLRRASKKSMK